MLNETRPVSAAEVRDAIAPGVTTRAELLARFGKTTVVSFDSGFEVWVYRYAGDAVQDLDLKTSAITSPDRVAPNAAARSNGEYVVLLSPSGVVARTRLRFPPQPASPAR